MRIELAEPQTLQDELAVAQSDAVLGAVTAGLDWEVKLGQTYNHGRTLTPNQALDLLRRIVVVRADTRTSEISIEAQDPDRADAARLANAIDMAYYLERHERQQVAELRERATPAAKPLPNNRGALLIAAAVAGLVAGFVVGSGVACMGAWRRGGLISGTPKPCPRCPS